MNAYVYILFSRKLNRYYIGSTELKPEERLELHLTKFYGASKFTANTDDWNLKFSIPCESATQARKIESYIKKMRNRKYLEWLISEPKAIQNITERFK
jgi:putative endonuclease